MAMPAPGDILAWTDEESTGLDDDDHVLELAVIFTDTQLRELGSFETLVRPQPSTFARIMSNDFVAKMHHANGLIDALDAADPDSLPTIGEVETQLLARIDEVAGPSQRVWMAGGGVSHYDLRHLGGWMPGLKRRVEYGTVDISDIVRGYIAATGNEKTFAKPPVKAHRAMDDVREELRIAPLIWDMFQQYNSRALGPEHQSTPEEMVLAGASLVQAASYPGRGQLAAMVDELSPRDAIAGLTSVASYLAGIVAEGRGMTVAAVLDEVRKRALT